jgi:hypothetical protein
VDRTRGGSQDAGDIVDRDASDVVERARDRRRDRKLRRRTERWQSDLGRLDEVDEPADEPAQ